VSNYRSNISVALQKHKFLQKNKTKTNQKNVPENLALKVLHVFSNSSENLLFLMPKMSPEHHLT